MKALAKKIRNVLFVSIRAVSYRALRYLNPEYQGGGDLKSELLAKDAGVRESALLGQVSKPILLTSGHRLMAQLTFSYPAFSGAHGTVEKLDQNVLPDLLSAARNVPKVFPDIWMSSNARLFKSPFTGVSR